MISVGVDVDRLGLMVVAGQPKGTEAAGVQGILLVTPGVDHGRPGIPRITALAELVELIGPD